MNIFPRFSRTVLIVFLSLTFTAPFAMAQSVTILDANLRIRIEAFLNKTPGDAITVADMRTLTLFSAVNADIRDLTGLEHATNLLWLELDNNVITDITPLTRLSKLALLYIGNNPLSAASIDRHIPVLRNRGVDVSYTLLSDVNDVNSDGVVNLQDLVSVTQHFGAAGDLTADVNRDGIVNIRDLTQVAGNLSPTGNAVPTNAADPTDTTDTVDTPATVPPDETPVRDAAFIFRKFIDHLIFDLRSVVISYDDADFQPPGKGFYDPHRPGDLFLRLSNHHVLGTFIPDPITTATIQQINNFSDEYKLRGKEFIDLLQNIRDAKIWVVAVVYRQVYMPDENLRKVVVVLINELGISLGPINRPKELYDPIYAGEMRQIQHIEAEAVGIEDLTGLEYATNLHTLSLGNIAARVFEEVLVDGVIRRKEIELEMPNKISDLTPLKELTDLVNLGLGLNEIEDLSPLSDLTNLRSLGLGENKITDIDSLANLTNLKGLTLGNALFGVNAPWGGDNEIRDLTPLRDLTHLEFLTVDDNPIGSSISIVRNFPKLKTLSISCCGVSNLSPLVKSQGLRGAGSYAQVGPNPLGEEDIPDIEALKNRGVEVSGPIYFKDHEGKILRDHEGKIRGFDNLLHLCSPSR